MKQYKKRYETLYEDVIQALKEVVTKSGQTSEHYEVPCIPVQEDKYTELTIIDDKLVLLDESGYQYNIHFLRLESFIDILENCTDFCRCTTGKFLIRIGGKELQYSATKGQQFTYRIRYGLFEIFVDEGWWLADRKLFKFENTLL